MNIFGRLAKFMFAYQEEIEIAFIVIVIAAAVFVIRRIVRASRKKRELLSQINDTVTQINTAVGAIGDKSSGVVYIDNRVGADARPEVVEAAVSQALAERPGEEEAAVKGYPPEAAGHAETAAVETAAETAAERSGTEAAAAESGQAAEAEAEERKEPERTEERKEPTAPAVRKYFSRDCAVSKNGRFYTLEELNDQIRE